MKPIKVFKTVLLDDVNGKLFESTKESRKCHYDPYNKLSLVK